MTLYYTGMRVGELCALTPADVDLEGHTITINKTFQRINGRDVIWPPKTPKSNRVVTIPQTLANCLKEYMDKCYEIQLDDRLFPYTKSFLNHEMLRGCKKSGVKKDPGTRSPPLPCKSSDRNGMPASSDCRPART